MTIKPSWSAVLIFLPFIAVAHYSSDTPTSIMPEFSRIDAAHPMQKDERVERRNGRHGRNGRDGLPGEAGESGEPGGDGVKGGNGGNGGNGG